METFSEWLNNQIFSSTPQDQCYLVYSEERDKYFWVVHARNWEEIHREAKWYSIVLKDRTAAANLLGGTPKKPCSTNDKELMERIQKADPDMENRDPDTRGYKSLNSALLDLSSTF